MIGNVIQGMRLTILASAHRRAGRGAVRCLDEEGLAT